MELNKQTSMLRLIEKVGEVLKTEHKFSIPTYVL